MLELKEYETKLKVPDQNDFLMFEFMRGSKYVARTLNIKDTIEYAASFLHRDVSSFANSLKEEKYETQGITIKKIVNVEKYNKYLKKYQEDIIILTELFFFDLKEKYFIKNKRKADKALDIAIKYSEGSRQKILEIYFELYELLK
jgi:hypothetical protein